MINNPNFDPDLSGWTATGNVISYPANCIFGAPHASFSFGNVPVNGVLSQDFFPMTGANLTFAMEYFGNGTCSPTANAQIEIIDNISGFVIKSYSFSDNSVCGGTNPTFSDNFIAPSSSLKIRITDTTPVSFLCDFDINSISITSPSNPVPTISQWGIIILGLVILNVGAIAIRQRFSLCQKVNNLS